MDDDAEIIAEFLVESHENLDQLDRDLVELEQNPGSRELLSSIFRTIHTIKGTSGFLAFGRLEKLTHVGETLLSKLRDGEKTMNPTIGDALLRMVDTVRSLLEAIEANGNDEDQSIDVVTVAAQIEALLSAEAPVAAVAATPAAAEAVAGGETAAPVAEVAVAVADVPVTEDEVAIPAPSAAPVEVPDTPAELIDTAPPADMPVEPAADGGAGRPVDPATGEPTERRAVADSSIRVDVEVLDALVDLVGELVLTRNQILQRTEGQEDIELIRASQRLDLVASELQESVMKTRMQPIGSVWSKMPRIVRDLAHQLGREVDLQMEGHETEMDRSVLEAVKDPLTHMVRNSMDHGIERPDDRVRAGKPRTGRLSLRAYHESGQVVVEIADDGKGIDPERIAAVALERGVVTRDQLARMDTREVTNLIFKPGFSTATEITNVSGRGVGMDVVRTNIERIGGTVDLTSEVGKGTTFRVRIPLTLAIIPALVVGEGGERYAIPQSNLVELVRIEGSDLERNVDDLAGAAVMRLRGKLLPLVSLSEALGGPAPEESETLTVVVVQADNVRFGLCVSEVHDTQEIVVKPVGRQLKGLAMYAGATIMGDGRVALILDVPGFASDQGVGAIQDDSNDTVAAGDDDRVSLLVLEVADGHRAALPLASVARLEEFERSRIEKSGTKEVVQYRNGILPLVRLAPAIGLQDTSNSQGDQISVVVHEFENHSVGLVIDRVLDVVETSVVASPVGTRTGVKGSAVVQDRVTDLVDIDEVIARTGVGA